MQTEAYSKSRLTSKTELLAETITLSDKTMSNKIFVTFAGQNILSGEKFWPFSEFEISSKKDRDPQFFYHKNTVTKKKKSWIAWIADLSKHLSDNQEIFVNSYDRAGISEAVIKASTIMNKVKNPVREVCKSDCRYIF